MKIGFNLLNCGLGNNGGSRTIIKSSETLEKLGHRSDLISKINRFTWFNYKQPLKSIPNDLDAIFATSCNTVNNTISTNIEKKYWWIRGHENWTMTDSQLIDLYNSEINLITNSISLKNRIQKLGCDKHIDVVYQGIDIHMWKDLNIRKNNKKVRIGCLYGTKPSKGWGYFTKLSRMLDSNKYELVSFGTSIPDCTFLSEFILNPSYKDLNRLYSSCDIWFAPTKSEGLHNVPMEAMLCGCLLICNDHDNNGMKYDYSFDRETSLVYQKIEDLPDILNDTSIDIASIINNGSDFIKNNIGSREDNMKKLVELIC